MNVKVSISELDLRVLPHPKETEMGADIRLNIERLNELDPYTKGIPKKCLRNRLKNTHLLFKNFSRV